MAWLSQKKKEKKADLPTLFLKETLPETENFFLGLITKKLIKETKLTKNQITEDDLMIFFLNLSALPAATEYYLSYVVSTSEGKQLIAELFVVWFLRLSSAFK